MMAQYLEDGAHIRVTEYGGVWSGTTKYTDVYYQQQYKRLVARNDVADHIAAGGVVIDARSYTHTHTHPVDGSVALSLLDTTTQDLQTFWDGLS